jgi:hypothetical protein
MRRIPLLIFVLAVNAGCATLPRTGTQATGEALSVQSHQETATWVEKTKVGEVENRDADGNLIGTSDVYQNQTRSADYTVWNGAQGQTVVDDQDFFQIAGDDAAADEIRSYRESGVTINRIGLVIGGVGLAGAVGGYGLALVGGNDTKSIGYAGATVGVLTALVGVGIAYWGKGRTNADLHLFDIGRARSAAQAYNTKLKQAAPANSRADITDVPLANADSSSAPAAAAPSKSSRKARKAHNITASVSTSAASASTSANSATAQ